MNKLKMAIYLHIYTDWQDWTLTKIEHATIMKKNKFELKSAKILCA